ncbi:juvenile hormone epoxide hydrolase 1-like [Nylanderia fulva]|uniref:juvenile hormone epoxide hydrolase 1-like n=1 Tax=Nylanderia fulva TaxID=613905 RepID=UPI0010FB02F7|nr:juvenile hormone epoxide hydrolase 1-like [Nylanderia fulva]
MDYPLIITISVGCCSVVYALIKYYSSKRSKLIELSETWWTPGTENSVSNDIRPYKIIFSEELVKDLKNRLKNTRPLTLPLKDVAWNYGTNTIALNKLLNYWADNYNFQEREKFVNQYPHFKTNIQGLDIHFIRVKPTNVGEKRVLPLLILHGWPGSIMEFYKIIPLLTTPKAEYDFVFEVIAPSLPGFGFSSPATIPGLSYIQMSMVLKNLMLRLGYDKFYIQGGDWGAIIVNAMSTLFPQNVLGMHSNMCSVMRNEVIVKQAICQYLFSFLPWTKKPRQTEKTSRKKFSLKRYLSETGYFHIQATKPDTVGVGLTDSPAGLAAYIIEKFSTGTNYSYKFRDDGGFLDKFTYDELIDNLMIYWASNSITTAMRIYAEMFTESNIPLGKLINSNVVEVPTACSQFPNEITEQPISLLRTRFVNLLRVTKMPQGGHFAALEEPELLANDIWASVNEMEVWHKNHNK